jgi:hypothetical protein
VAIEFGFGIIHWNVNNNSGIEVDQYLCILLCVCVCAYTSVLGRMNGLMDTAYATTFTCTFTSLHVLFYMYILSR